MLQCPNGGFAPDLDSMVFCHEGQQEGAPRGVVPFLQEALALLPAGTWLRTVRADSGFFDGSFLDFLEERPLPYVVVARLQRASLRGATD